MLLVAFRIHNDDGQQHLETDNYVTLEVAEEGRTFSRDMYLNFNTLFFQLHSFRTGSFFL